ncbi:MAG: metal ABC transporter ATP-binding protein [Candidatus Aminicenantes bacterium]
MDSPADKTKELISVDDVSFSYGYNPVLSHVSFPIHAGDFLALIGPNGSGKTTLLKIILGLLKPSLGIIRIQGKPVDEFKDWQKIGYVPQKATHIDPLFPASVKEIVGMGLLAGRKIPVLSKRDKTPHVEKVLSQVGLQDLKDWRIGKLSLGQQQRVFIARAIVNKPQILFLDEPTTGVDSRTHELFYDMLDGLNKKEGMTIVLVTHEIGIINKHVSQVACLNQRLVYHGTHSEFCRSDAFKEMLVGGHHVISHQH